MQTKKALVFLVLGAANLLYASDKKNDSLALRRYKEQGYILPERALSVMLTRCTADDNTPNNRPILNTPIKPKASSLPKSNRTELFHIIIDKLKSNLMTQEGVRIVHGIPFTKFKSSL